MTGRAAWPRRRDERWNAGNAAVEFALVGPLFLFLLIGLVVYGGWFWMAAEVQHLSAEGARAAVAGLSNAEREQLARSAILTDSGEGLVPRAALLVRVQSDAEVVSVTVSYPASGHPLMALAELVPSPPTTIERVSTVRKGGY